jgi:predicted AAA+ superfamily ATPase
MVTVTPVTRKEVQTVRRAKGWVLLHGRRKTGKTFLVRNFIPHDLYILVKRGGGALLVGGPLERMDDYGQVEDIIFRSLDEGKTVVVDEFQRLPADFSEILQLRQGKGRLILLGSSMHVSRDLLSRKSPLLGLLSEVRLSLLSPVDILLALSKETPAEDAITLAPYLRDPWTLRFLEKDPQRTVLDIMEYSRSAIPALIGEIFLEEDRFMSEVYEAIIRSVAAGKNTLKEVADRLFAMKLIRSADPSSVRPYIKIMEDMDLVERIPVFNGRGNHYAIRSKVMDLYYYLDEKYGPEAENPDFVREVFRDRMPFHVQFFLGELMAEILGGAFKYRMNGDGEIDMIITRRNKPVFVGEVKWGRKVDRSELGSFEEKTRNFDCRKAILARNPIAYKGIEVLTPDKVLALAKESQKRRG